METWAFWAMGAVNIACFIVGAKVGLAVKKGKDIEDEFRTASPIERIKTHRKKKEAQKDQDRLNTIMRNIEGYNGTGLGQIDVPRR